MVILTIAWAVLGYMLFLVLRHRRRPGGTQVRALSHEHEKHQAAFRDWLNTPEIVHAAIRRGTITADGLVRAKVAATRANYPMLRAIMAVLLQDRVVRQLCAKRVVELSRFHGEKVDRKAVMKMLTKLAEEVRH